MDPGLSVITGIQVQKFLLVLARVSAMIYLFPIFGSNQIPAYMKAGFSAAVTLLLVFAMPTHLGEVLPFGSFMVQVAVQAFVGIVIGYCAFIVFHAILLAGQIIDIEMGFALANVIDPVNNIQQSLIGQFQHLLALMFFLAIDGHHKLILLLSKTFETIPLGQPFYFTNKVGVLLIDMFGSIFALALQLAFPIIGAMFLTDLVLGLLSRLVPQMNVFVVGFPIKLALGMWTLIILMGGLGHLYPDIFDQSIVNLLRLTRYLGAP